MRIADKNDQGYLNGYKNYTPDLTEFNTKITDKGGIPISNHSYDGAFAGSTVQDGKVYYLMTSDGSVKQGAWESDNYKVRAIMEF